MLRYAILSRGPSRSSVLGKDQEHISSKHYSINQWGQDLRMAVVLVDVREVFVLCSYAFLRTLFACILLGSND